MKAASEKSRQRRRAPSPKAPSSRRLSPTEQRNPRSMHLDRLPIRDAIRLMLSEEAKVPGILLSDLPRIERVIRLVTASLREGGRLFYVGAGTSGRLGVLDASECPPTFHTKPEQVQGIIAGGPAALLRSVEGAEDDAAAGAGAITAHRIGAKDAVVGIAASGTTPFVWGALAESRRRKAKTALVCFNPYLSIPVSLRPNIVLCFNLGPEVLTGSTRLKAGTATKLLLNLFTTLSMVRLGKVRSNLMVDVKPSNTKLKHRAVRIVRLLTGMNDEAALIALKQHQWDVRQTVDNLMLVQAPRS